MQKEKFMPSLLEGALKVTEAAAMACYPWIGKGDGMAADAAAVQSMRQELNHMPILGRVVIGEGERDEAPMLYIGEEVGLGGIGVDIALDPLEGTALCAEARPNAITVLAMAPSGTLLHAPDVYMEKIVVGSGLPHGILNLDDTPIVNLQRIAEAKDCYVADLTVCVLKRDRHAELIAQVRQSGARVCLIDDGDVLAALATSLLDSGIDVYIGTGGAPEGVLAAAALKCIGGQMLGRLVFRDAAQQKRAVAMGCRPGQVYSIDDMVRSDVLFVATGVTSGELLQGVEIDADDIYTHSIVATTYAAPLRYIHSRHRC